MPETPSIDTASSQRPVTPIALHPLAPSNSVDEQQARWARIATSNGWLPPDVVYLVEHAAALQSVQELVETLTALLPFDQWLVVAHAANKITDDVAADCPCHPAAGADHSVAQDGLW